MLKTRVAIPLHNADGKLVGYAGRVVDDSMITEDNPRYRFPGKREKDGTVFEFRKTLFLYNGFRIKAPVDNLIIVEGFTGVWWLNQNGLPSVVATMGADCSERQAELIVSLVKPNGKVWIAPDGDAAGLRHAQTLLTLLSPHRAIRWLKLDDGKQPTDLSGEQLPVGINQFRDLRNHLINPYTWMRFVGDNLYIGQDYTLGCWVLPVAKLEAALADATGVQLAKTRQDEEARRQWQARMTAQFGPATNPDLDPVKKAAAMDDPDFIAWELDNIDTNHNGWLDLGEFAWFDAHHNQILDPKEQAGMEIAQHLLAERLFKQFDEWGDGLLDQDQFRALIHAAGIQRELALRSMYVEHVDLPGVESLLNQQSRLALRIRETPRMGYPGPAQLNGGIAIDARQQFKTAVEAYWQNPGSVTNPLSPNPYQPRPATP